MNPPTVDWRNEPAVTFRGVYKPHGNRDGQPVTVTAVDMVAAYPGTSATAPDYTVRFPDGTVAYSIWSEELATDQTCPAGHMILTVAGTVVHLASGQPCPHLPDRGENRP